MLHTYELIVHLNVVTKRMHKPRMYETQPGITRRLESLCLTEPQIKLVIHQHKYCETNIVMVSQRCYLTAQCSINAMRKL